MRKAGRSPGGEKTPRQTRRAGPLRSTYVPVANIETPCELGRGCETLRAHLHTAAVKCGWTYGLRITACVRLVLLTHLDSYKLRSESSALSHTRGPILFSNDS